MKMVFQKMTNAALSDTLWRMLIQQISAPRQ